MKSLRVKVVQTEVDPVPVEILATSIRDIGIAMRRIESSGLSQRALALLLSDSSRESMSVVVRVLNALGSLERNFIRNTEGKK